MINTKTHFEKCSDITALADRLSSQCLNDDENK